MCRLSRKTWCQIMLVCLQFKKLNALSVRFFLALSKTASLHPSPTVNRLFSRLVRICSTVPCRVAQIILAAPDITSITERLRHLCSCGESELERFWSQKICSSTKPLRVLEQFPYICNYREAARIEWQMACAVHKKTIKKL